jgi:hypothetical protein
MNTSNSARQLLKFRTFPDAVDLEDLDCWRLIAPVTAIKDNSTGLYDHLPARDEVVPIHKPVRRRNKAHLRFVAAQPCLICRRSPCDAHHLKFAQPRTLGRKVSDEFTVPLCRDHHVELHRQGNERAWWAGVQVSPVEVAKELWRETLLGKERAQLRDEPDGGLRPL